MFSKRILTMSAMSLMAVALLIASACSSETQVSEVADSSDDNGAISSQSSGGDDRPTTIEPDEPAAIGSEGIPDPNADTDGSMIAVLDGADADNGTRLSDDELFADGEPRDGAEPLDTDSVHDLSDFADGPVRDPADSEISDGLPLAEGVLNPDSCENVLPPAPEPFEIKTRSATDPAKADNAAVETMCTAWYSSDVNENSASLSLIMMSDAEAAIGHYDVLRSQFSQGSIEFEEQRSRSQDWLTTTLDQGGIGSMVVLRIGANLVSVHSGPTSDQKEWSSHWMLDLAHSTLERVS